MAEIPTFKVCVIGDGEVGKTTFINRHITGEYQKTYVPTLGVEVSPLVFNTSKGMIRFNVWDCAGQAKFGGLGDGYYIASDAFLIFGALDNMASAMNIGIWAWEVKRVTEHVHKAICLNKADLPNQEKVITPRQREFMKLTHQCPVYEVSARSTTNFEEPFLYLARKLMNDETLIFTEMPAVRPPEVIISDDDDM